MPTEKLYTPADIMRALPTLMTLWHKPFKDLKEMYRAGGGPKKGHHLTKRDCVMFIAFGSPTPAEAGAPQEEDPLAKAQRTIGEMTLQLTAANAGNKTLREEHGRMMDRDTRISIDLSMMEEKNRQLIGTLRQLMSL